MKGDIQGTGSEGIAPLLARIGEKLERCCWQDVELAADAGSNPAGAAGDVGHHAAPPFAGRTIKDAAKW